MLNLKKHDEEVLKSLKNIRKNVCPNIFVTGKSLSAMESLSFQIVDFLEQRGIMKFKGIYKHFTIRMPYFDSREDAIRFLSHLCDSISIAQDCYDSFCGFILIELSEKWADEGNSEALDIFWDYVNENKNICFILLCLEAKDRVKTDNLFADFAKCGLCLKIRSETPTVHQCVSIFRRMAGKQGYRISEDTEQFLYRKLKEREEIKKQNIEVVTGLMEQIILDKSFAQIKSQSIYIEDIQKYLPDEKKKSRTTIGFVRDVD